jgi:hypothetical protein
MQIMAMTSWFRLLEIRVRRLGDTLLGSTGVKNKLVPS